MSAVATSVPAARTGAARWLPWSGIAFVVLAIASPVLAGGVPAAQDESPAALLEYAADREVQLVLAAWLSGVAGVLFLAFGLHLRSMVAGGGILRDLLLAGTVLVGLSCGVDSSILFALGTTGGDIDPTATQALTALYGSTIGVMVLGLAPFLIAVAALTLRDGLLPRWLGWTAAAFAVVALTPFPWPAIAGVLVIALAASVVLLRRN